jgi:hypothetical protein
MFVGFVGLELFEFGDIVNKGGDGCHIHAAVGAIYAWLEVFLIFFDEVGSIASFDEIRNF